MAVVYWIIMILASAVAQKAAAFWRTESVRCPLCASSPSVVYPQAICTDTDESILPDAYCKNAKPHVGEVSCPPQMHPTCAPQAVSPEDCVDQDEAMLAKFGMSCAQMAAAYDCGKWPRATAAQCPVACGLCEPYGWEIMRPAICPAPCGTQTAYPMVQCVHGKDATPVSQSMCAHLPVPQPTLCPNIVPCEVPKQVLYQAVAVEEPQCPTACGLGPSVMLVPLVCVGTDGEIDDTFEYCGEQDTAMVECPATVACPPVDCFFGAWSDWSGVCSRPCGGGVETRTRVLEQPVGSVCSPPPQSQLQQERPCNTAPCQTPVVEVEVRVPVPVPVGVDIPVRVPVPVSVEIPVEVRVPVPIEVRVPVTVPLPYPVPITVRSGPGHHGKHHKPPPGL